MFWYKSGTDFWGAMTGKGQAVISTPLPRSHAIGEMHFVGCGLLL
jgi:hypothetical protein